MERKYHMKLSKAHHNILTCLDVAFAKRDINLILENVQRLNGLTTYLMRNADLQMINIDMLKAENETLEAENRKLMDERFLQISEEKGRYQEAKKMLDDFYSEI